MSINEHYCYYLPFSLLESPDIESTWPGIAMLKHEIQKCLLSARCQAIKIWISVIPHSIIQDTPHQNWIAHTNNKLFHVYRGTSSNITRIMWVKFWERFNFVSTTRYSYSVCVTSCQSSTLHNTYASRSYGAICYWILQDNWG